MKFRIDGLGEHNTYIELESKGAWIEFGAGYPDSARRAFVTGIGRTNALALAKALEAIARSLDS